MAAAAAAADWLRPRALRAGIGCGGSAGRRERARVRPVCLRVLLRGRTERAGSESPGRAARPRGRRSAGRPPRARPCRRRRCCTAPPVLQNSFIGWIWQNGLTPGSCRYCPVQRSEGFRGQDEVQLCRDRAVLLGCVLERKESHGTCCSELPFSARIPSAEPW